MNSTNAEQHNMAPLSKYVSILLGTLLVILLNACQGERDQWELRSPDRKIRIEISKQGDPVRMQDTLSYSVYIMHEGRSQMILGPSPLGMTREDGRFRENLSFLSAEKRQNVRDSYRLVSGKQLACENQYNEMVLQFHNPDGEKMNLVIRAYDGGLAFRYTFPENLEKHARVLGEHTGFKVGSGKAWAHPYDTVTKWNPAYETFYKGPMEIGTDAPWNKNGWAFPMLFETNGAWILISESGFDGTYGASHIQRDCQKGLYRIRFAEAAEAMGYYENTSHAELPWETPWRFMVIGKSLADIVESNLVTDLAQPCRLDDTDWIMPGRASWSWWSDSDSPQDYNRLQPFVDFAADMGWEYSLVDANWNRMKNGSIKKLAEYASGKGVGLLLWYNSGGKHNAVTEEPRDLMFDREARRKEFERISSLGIKGIKVDFFQSDKQEIIKQYIEILEDAAEYHLLVNFHGCTLPRGWRRTWPNLLSMEAVRGGECYKFDHSFPEKAPAHLATIPYTRNVVGPCDYTPGCFSNHTYPHLTSYGFELALMVVLESGIMHYADTPAKTQELPEYVVNFLKELPVSWDETRFLAGYPGKDVVIARRKGEHWYFGGINGEAKKKELTIDLEAIVPPGASIEFLSDGSDEDLFEQCLLVPYKSTYTIDLQPYGGFVGIAGIAE